MKDLLEKYSNNPVFILSGEGEKGTFNLHRGKLTQRAIRRALSIARSNGDRWAKAIMYMDTNKGGPYGIDLESGDEHPINMKGNFYAVYQIGYVIFGVGESKDEAVHDAREWIDPQDDIDLVERHEAVVGDLVCMPCSLALYCEVQSNGGDVYVKDDHGTLSLDEEYEEE